ncbi:MAG: hypothetical protein R3Y43_04265 [Alphaproteobacteria bacterium]
MIKLKIQKEPYWLELGSGVKVKVKPCTSAVFYEAKAFMHARISAMAKKYKEEKELGISSSTLIDLENPQKREAFADQNLILGLALAGIIEWDGILEADNDNKAPATPEKIEELFSNFWVLAENFRNQYSGIVEMIEAEKNALSLDVNGTLAKGENIAKAAFKTTNSAQSTSASISEQA